MQHAAEPRPTRQAAGVCKLIKAAKQRHARHTDRQSGSPERQVSMCVALAAEHHAVGQRDVGPVEDDVADADVWLLACALICVATILGTVLGRQVLLVHQLDQDRIAGSEVLEADPEPVRGTNFVMA